MAFEGPFLGLEKIVLAAFGWIGGLIWKPVSGLMMKNKKLSKEDNVVCYSYTKIPDGQP